MGETGNIHKVVNVKWPCGTLQRIWENNIKMISKQVLKWMNWLRIVPSSGCWYW
jgi:hypothetical protein